MLLDGDAQAIVRTGRLPVILEVVGQGEDVALGFHVAPHFLPHVLIGHLSALAPPQKPCDLLVVIHFRELEEIQNHEGEIVRDERLLDKELQQSLQLSKQGLVPGLAAGFREDAQEEPGHVQRETVTQMGAQPAVLIAQRPVRYILAEKGRLDIERYGAHFRIRVRGEHVDLGLVTDGVRAETPVRVPVVPPRDQPGACEQPVGFILELLVQYPVDDELCQVDNLVALRGKLRPRQLYRRDVVDIDHCPKRGGRHGVNCEAICQPVVGHLHALQRLVVSGEPLHARRSQADLEGKVEAFSRHGMKPAGSPRRSSREPASSGERRDCQAENRNSEDQRIVDEVANQVDQPVPSAFTGRGRYGTGFAGSDTYSSNFASSGGGASKDSPPPEVRYIGVGATGHPFSQLAGKTLGLSQRSRPTS